MSNDSWLTARIYVCTRKLVDISLSFGFLSRMVGLSSHINFIDFLKISLEVFMHFE